MKTFLMPTRPLWPLVLCVAHTVAAATEQPVSQAERLLFVDQHLSSVKPPLVLRYDYRKTGSLEKGTQDQVVLQLSASADGRCCNSKMSFVGERPPLSPLEVVEAKSNPVIMYFLEQEVREMQRLTRGQPNYFRKRIRMALADQAQVTPITVRYRDRDVPAQRVSISPYANDPTRARYDRFADKQYIFVLAEALPGGVAQIRTLLPAALPVDPPMLQETLTLQEVKSP